MSPERLVIGTRGSELALWQAQWVQSELMRQFTSLMVDLRIIKTTGDKILDSPLSKIGDKGLFTREIEQALIEKRVDIAVHSLKDLPTETPDGLTIGAVTQREDVSDVFISHPSKNYTSFTELPQNAVIATGSLRRRCQILHRRPDIRIVDIRGNIRTRFRKLAESNWDGILLAQAGVHRLELDDEIGFRFDPIEFLPAVGQGALGIEIRTADEHTEKYIAVLHHPATAKATSSERALLRTLEGGCQIPVGAYGRIHGDVLALDAMVGSLDGTTIIRDTASGPADDPETLGRRLAESLLHKGAASILKALRSGNDSG
jgi:hydroxymethylbilane synthase